MSRALLPWTLTAFALALACSGPHQAPTQPAPPGTAATPLAANPETSPSTPSPDPGPAPRATMAATPPVPLGVPQPVSFAGSQVTATLCRLDAAGSPLTQPRATADHRALNALAIDGETLLLIDHEHKLRRYLRQDSRDCELALDKNFGDAGVLTVAPASDEARHDWFNALSVDAHGGIYISGLHAHPRKVLGERIQNLCARSGPLRVFADGQQAAFGQRVINLDDQCGDSGARPRHWPKSVGSYHLAPVGDRLFASRFDGNSFVVSFHERNGELLWRYPDAGVKEGIKHITKAESCRAGLCVLNANGRELVALSGKGEHLGELELQDLLGQSPDWAQDITIGRGVAYLAVLADDPKVAKRQHGLIYALKGL